MTTKQIFCQYNKWLKSHLIPKGNEPIIGCLTNPNDEIFNQKLTK